MGKNNQKLKVGIDFDVGNYSKNDSKLLFGKFFTELVKIQDKQSKKRGLRICETY